MSTIGFAFFLLASLSAVSCRNGVQPAGSDASRTVAAAQVDNGTLREDPVASADRTGAEDQALARVYGKPVSIEEYGAYLDLFVLKKQRSPDNLRKALLGLINNRLLAAKAVEDGIDREPSVRGKVDLAVGRIWKDAYWNKVVLPTVSVTDGEILEDAPEFHDAVHVFQIVVADRSKAEALRVRIVEQGESFSVVAREESEGLTAAQGGDVGFISQGTSIYDNAVLSELLGLKTGEISRVISTKIGYSLFQVTEKKPASEFRRDWLEKRRPYAMEAEGQKAWDRHIQDLKKTHAIVVHEEEGKALVEAMLRKQDLRPYAKTVLVEVDGKKWLAEDLIDPSGTGVLHGPEVLQSLLDSRMREYLVGSEVEKLGLKKGFPELRLKERLLRENVLAREVVNRAVQGIRITDDDFERYYRDYPEKFSAPSMLDISVIEVKSRQSLETVYRDLAAGKNFGETASKYSANRKLKEGRVGWVAESRINAPFASVRGLKVGEYSREPIELRDPKSEETTFVVARLNDVREGGRIPRSEVRRADVEPALIAWKREDVLARLFDRLKASTKVTIKEDADRQLRQFQYESSPGGHHAASDQ